MTVMQKTKKNMTQLLKTLIILIAVIILNIQTRIKTMLKSPMKHMVSLFICTQFVLINLANHFLF